MVQRREEGASLRTIADEVGVHHKTVLKAISGGEKAPPATVTGKDGKQYPAKKPKKVNIESQKDLEKAINPAVAEKAQRSFCYVFFCPGLPV